MLAALKHPLAKSGDERLGWLEQMRRLDLLLRGPRPPAGLAGIATLLLAVGRSRGGVSATGGRTLPPILAPLEDAFARERPLPDLLAGAARDGVGADRRARVGRASGPRCCHALFAELEAAAPHGPPTADPKGFVAMLAQALRRGRHSSATGRRHPRIQILGLLEARLQQADLMILAGLNEGVWPGLPQPDPWLAPRIRRGLGLAWASSGASACPRMTSPTGSGRHGSSSSRARRDTGAPTIASRFWLRLRAMTGDRGPRTRRLIVLARRSTSRSRKRRAIRSPRPAHGGSAPRGDIAVTDIDRLRADPYAFYAAKILDAAVARSGRCRSGPGLARHGGACGASALDGGGRRATLNA